jgi:hypothetical protein
MLKGINRVKIAMPILITAFLLVLLFLTLLATVQYSIESVNWGDFAFSIFYWISGRMTYFSLGMEIGELNAEVQMLEATISKYRKQIFKAKANKPVADKFKQKNLCSKVNAYIDKLDLELSALSNKQSKRSQKRCNDIMKKREEAILYLDCLEKGEAYKGKFNINNVKVKYDILDFGTCFSYGNKARNIGHKYKINVQGEGIKKSVPSFIWSVAMSFMSASLSIMTYGFTWMALMTFIIKLVLFLMGCYNGITLGRSVIETDKYNVLLNITEAIKETITEVEQEQGIKIDTPEN